MKTIRLNIFIVIFTSVVLFLSSCEKVVPLEVDDVETKGVLNSLFNQGQQISVSLSHSSVIGSGSNTGPINNEIIRLFADGEFVEELNEVSSGVYNSTIIAESGVNYSIETNTQYGMLSAQSRVPEVVDVVSIDTVVPTTIVMDSWIGPETAFVGNITFNDPAEDNFYLLQLISIDTAYGNEEPYSAAMFYYEYDYRSVSSDIGDESYIMTYLYLRFPDVEFPGEQKTYKFGIYPYSLNSTNLYFLKVYSLDRAFYDYLATYETYEQVSYDIFAEPINIYSNVDGGIGIFAGASVSIYPLNIDIESIYDK